MLAHKKVKTSKAPAAKKAKKGHSASTAAPVVSPTDAPSALPTSLPTTAAPVATCGDVLQPCTAVPDNCCVGLTCVMATVGDIGDTTVTGFFCLPPGS